VIRTVKYLMNHREVEYDSDVDQDFDDDPFVESHSDVEETVTVKTPVKYVAWHSKALKFI
jgi:hypothetical protein